MNNSSGKGVYGDRKEKGDIFVNLNKNEELDITFRKGSEKKITQGETDYINLALDPENIYRLYFIKGHNDNDGWKVYENSANTKSMKPKKKSLIEWGKDARGAYFFKYDKERCAYYIEKKTPSETFKKADNQWTATFILTISENELNACRAVIRLAEKIIESAKEN